MYTQGFVCKDCGGKVKIDSHAAGGDRRFSLKDCWSIRCENCPDRVTDVYPGETKDMSREDPTPI